MANIFADFDISGVEDEEEEQKEQERVARNAVRGFDDNDLKTCLMVLGAFKDKKANLDDLEYRDLRIACQPLAEHFNERFYEGMSLEDYSERRLNKQIRDSQKEQYRAADKIHRENRRMKSVRLDRLNALQARDELRTLEAPPPVSCANALPTKSITSSGDESSTVVAVAGDEDEEQSHRMKTKTMKCYMCKMVFHDMHHFYEHLCPRCAELNYERRIMTVDLKGRWVLLTGGRLKIGFFAGLKLLRCGADVIVTTRFPHDAALRYSQMADFNDWKDRVHIVGLDLRDLAGLERFCDHLVDTIPHLDGIVNNAAQTVRKPAPFYAHLLENEMTSADDLPGGVGSLLLPGCDHHSRDNILAAKDTLLLSADSKHADDVEFHKATETTSTSAKASPSATGVAAALNPDTSRHNLAAAFSQLPVLKDDLVTHIAKAEEVGEGSETSLVAGDGKDHVALYPEQELDCDLQQVDLRVHNSWKFRLHEVQTPELAETMAINALAPFVLNARLKPLLQRSPFEDRYVVNVSAMEGKFYRHKTDKHPHTNMAKAAMNMMTRTSAGDFVKDNIYMTSVDTGWITDENPHHVTKMKVEQMDFSTPLDQVDAAARIIDPILSGIQDPEARVHGVFLKDYRETEW